jgi:hypothetical protein
MKAYHSVSILGGSDSSRNDGLVVAIKNDVANLIGGSAGAAVTTAVAFTGLPPAYNVQVTPHQDAAAHVINKTAAGFDVVLRPRLAADTLAASTFDVLVTA